MILYGILSVGDCLGRNGGTYLEVWPCRSQGRRGAGGTLLQGAPRLARKREERVESWQACAEEVLHDYSATSRPPLATYPQQSHAWLEFQQQCWLALPAAQIRGWPGFLQELRPNGAGSSKEGRRLKKMPGVGRKEEKAVRARLWLPQSGVEEPGSACPFTGAEQRRGWLTSQGTPGVETYQRTGQAAGTRIG